MKRFLSNLAYGVAGLSVIVGCVVWSCYHGISGDVAMYAFGGILLMVMSWGLFYSDKRDNISYRPEISKADMLQCAKVECMIPFDQLHANFLRLSKRDDLIVAEKDYLSWNSGSFAEIRVTRLDREKWVCICWSRASWSLPDSVMESICRENGIQMPSDFRKMKPHGLAFYSQGYLNIYPAKLKEDFTDEFCATVLSQGPEFERWVKDYYEDGEE